MKKLILIFLMLFVGYAYADDVEFYDTKDETKKWRFCQQRNSRRFLVAMMRQVANVCRQKRVSRKLKTGMTGWVTFIATAFS